MKNSNQPYGVSLINSAISGSYTVDEVSKSLFVPQQDYKSMVDSFNNPANPYAKNGFVMESYNPIKYTKTEKKKQEYNAGQDKVETAFSTIPRLAGMFGNYVAPPSKVPFSEMYEASLDSTLGACIDVTKALVISGLGTYKHKDKKKEKLIQYTLKNLEKNNFLSNALDFLKFGFSVGEKVWSVTSDGYNYISDIIFAPQTNMQFSIDERGRMQTAMQPILTSSNYGTFGGADLDMPESEFAYRELVPSVIPFTYCDREDLFYCAIDNTFSPYGISPIRRAYKYWAMKNDALQMNITAMSKNGVPIFAVNYNQQTLKDDQKEEFEEKMSSYAVGDVILFPAMEDAIKAQSISVDSGSIGYFKDFSIYCDQMMIRAYGFPAEILIESGGSYSSGTIKKETYEDRIKTIIDLVSMSVFNDVIEPILEANFTDNNDEYGCFTSEIRMSDMLELNKIVELAKNNGIFNSELLEDVNNIRAKMGWMPLTKSQLPPEQDVQKTNTRGLQKEFANNVGKEHTSNGK